MVAPERVVTPAKEASEPNAEDRVFSWPNLLIVSELVLVAILLFVALDRICGVSILGKSGAPYYVDQAWSWLHGRWDLDAPGQSVDIIVLHGKSISIYPPFPSVLLLPFVAIWGTQVSDILFGIVMGGIMLGALYLLLEQLRVSGLSRRSQRENLSWTLLMFFGSIAVWLSMGGAIWFNGHIVAAGCLLVSLLLAFRRQYFWSAIALGCGFMTRSTLFLGFPFLFFLAWHDANRFQTLQELISATRSRAYKLSSVPWLRFISIGVVAVAFVGLYLARNQILFGNPFETGLKYNLALHPAETSASLGVFNIRYVPANFISTFLNMPRFLYSNGFDYRPRLDMMGGYGNGVSVFVTSPLFLLFFLRKHWPKNLLQLALWSAAGLMVAFVLCFFTAGWLEFGARYVFDAYPYVWVLLALSEIRLSRGVVLLGLFGVLMNLLGAAEFWGHIVLSV